MVYNTKSYRNIIWHYELIHLAEFQAFLYLLSTNIGEMQFTSMNAMESIVKLSLIFVLKVFISHPVRKQK